MCDYENNSLKGLYLQITSKIGKQRSIKTEFI